MEIKCCNDGEILSFDIKLYLATVSLKKIEVLKGDKGLILLIHKHLKNFDTCEKYYREFKGKMAAGNYAPEVFTPTAFRLIKENEKYLDNIL